MRRILQQADNGFQTHPNGAPMVYGLVTLVVALVGGQWLAHQLEASSAASLIHAIQGHPIAGGWGDWHTFLWEVCLILLPLGTFLAGMVYGWAIRGVRTG